MAEDDTIERFFTHLTARAWESLAQILSEDVVRIGPFGDAVSGRAQYLDLLRGTVPSEYGNDVHRIMYAPDRRAAFARVSEHLHYAEQDLDLEEAYAFEIDPEGRLTRVEVYWQTPQFDPGAFGSAAASESFASGGGEPDSARLGIASA